MELRYRMAVVTAAGAGLGREMAIALGRRGMSVLAADVDLAAAQRTAELVRASRVVAWPLQVDLAHTSDLRLLMDRARDLGGADVLVDCATSAPPGDPEGGPPAVLEAFLDALPTRRAPDLPAASVTIVGSTGHRAPPPKGGGSAHLAGIGRVMTVVIGSDTGEAGGADGVAMSEVCTAVLDLLGNGTDGQSSTLSSTPTRHQPAVPNVIRTT